MSSQSCFTPTVRLQQETKRHTQQLSPYFHLKNLSRSAAVYSRDEGRGAGGEFALDLQPTNKRSKEIMMIWITKTTKEAEE